MNHDYAHCADYTDDCPKECFRGELVRDYLKNNYTFASWANFKGTGNCMIADKESKGSQHEF